MVMGAGGMGAGGTGASYQEVIRITIDERHFNQQVQQTEQRFNQMVERMKKMQTMQMKLTLNDQASSHMQNVQREVSKLNQSSRTTIRVGVTDQASSRLKQIQAEVDKLSRGATVRASTGGGGGGGGAGPAGGLVSRAGAAVGGLQNTAGSVVGAVAPELGAAGGASALMGGGALVAGGAVAGVAAVGVALAAATRDSADFNHELMIVKNNTTMTSDEMQVLRRAVSDESQEFGISTSSLIDASRQIQDLTQNADAMQGILRVAGEAAGATGADVSQVGNILASTLHQYHLDMGTTAKVTENAAHAMGVLHVASAEGNMTMQQFADYSGRAVALASQLNIPLEQVSAAMAALTRNGYDAAQSQTQVVNIMTHVVKPAKQAQDEIARLTKVTGVDLVNAYSATGLSQLGFTGVFDKTVEAYHRMGLTQEQATEETLKLLNAQRGGIGAALLMGKGATDYSQILKDLNNEQLTGQYVTKAWADAQKDPEVRLAQLQQRMVAFGRSVGDMLLPALNAGMDLALHMGDALDQAGKDIQSSGIADSVRAIYEGITGDPGAFGVLQQQIEQTFGPQAGDMTRPLLQGIMDNRDQLVLWGRTIGDVILPGFAAWDQATNGSVALQQTLGGVGQQAADMLSNAWAGVPPDIRNDLELVGGALGEKLSEFAATSYSKGTEMAQALSRAWQEQAQPFIDGLVDIAHNAMDAMGNFWTQTAGPWLADRFWDGMRGALDFLKQQLGIASPSTVFQGIGKDLMQGLANGLSDNMGPVTGAIGQLVESIKSGIGGVASNLGGWVSSHLPGGTGDVGGWIQAAMSAAGVDPSKWAGGLNTIIMHESSGDPNAANLWDVNAKAGDPSRGLMQLTGTNRARYTPAGMDPMDPVAQIVAGIGYIKERYGDINNVPGVRSVAGGGGYLPYDIGGFLQPGMNLAFNNTGAPELVIPPRVLGGAAASKNQVAGQLPRGPLVSIGQIVQQPGEDAVAFAQRVGSLVTRHLDRWSEHFDEAMASMPDGAF